MSDCLDARCPLQKKCRRWQPKARLFTPYYSESPREGETCLEYWPKKLEDAN